MVTTMERIEYCNIWLHKCKPVLGKAEKWCPKCNGLGASFADISFKQRYVTLKKCLICEGKGKVDWISAITQRPIHPNNKFKFNLKNSKDVRLRCPGHLRCKKRLKRMWQETKKFSPGPWHEDYIW